MRHNIEVIDAGHTTNSANLVHGEAEIGDDLFTGNALAAVAEVLIGGVQGTAIFLGQFVVLVVIIDHHFQQRPDRAC